MCIDTTRVASVFILQPHFGFVIPHRSEMQHLITGHSFGLNAQYLFQTRGDKAWHQWHGLPLQGVDLYYCNTGNARQLGHQLALSYLVKLPLRKTHRIAQKARYFHHTLGLGIGAGYNTKTWDLEENHQAQVIGSNFNAALSVEYSARIFQTKSHGLYVGIRLTHFSNGAFQLPNLGTNNIALHTSYAYGETVKKYRSTDRISKNRLIQLALLSGLKEITPPNGKKYASFTISGIYEKHRNAKNTFGVGADLFFSNAVKTLKNRFSEQPVGWDESAQVGLLFSYGLHFERMVMRIQQGVYVWNAWEADGSLYQRVSLRYQLTPQLFCHLGLKTHFAKADHAEIGIGYSFIKQP